MNIISIGRTKRILGSLGLFKFFCLLLTCAPSSNAMALDSVSAEFGDIAAGLPGVAGGALAWGDYDNDGDLDLAMVGDTDLEVGVARVYRNDAGTFTDILASLPYVYSSSLAWGDYDNDGDLDLAIAGATASFQGIARVYRNDSGTFIDANVGLPQVWGGSVAWGDYDNDGDQDLLLTGITGPMLAFSRVYRNDAGSFTDIAAGLQAAAGAAVWGDYDNDGDLDILLTGSTPPYGRGRISRLYRNDAGAFTNTAVGLPDVGGGGVAWGDYDNDGDLDLALTGGMNDWGATPITRLYRNDLGTLTDIGGGLPADGARPAWGDYDNDGDLDLLLSTTSSTRIFRNSGGVFADIVTPLSEISQSMSAWGDFDGDGDLDIALMGVWAGERTARIFRSDGIPGNSPPGPPVGLSTTIDEDRVTFRWDAATDAETPSAGLSYNLRIGTTPGGSQVMSAMAAGNSGCRRVAAIGNAQQRLSWTVVLPQPSGYYWSVQAIDGSWTGSPFAAEQAIGGPIVPFVDATDDYPGLDDFGSGNSVAWIDYDHDGDLDLSVGAGSNNVNRLFLNRLTESGSVSFDSVNNPLIANPNTTRGLGWGIFNQVDLCPDLYQGAPLTGNVMLDNACGSISDVTNAVTAGSSDETNGIRVVDFDRDGRLDIHELRPHAPDRLLRNLGDWQFQEMPTSAISIVEGSFDAAWADVDGDRDQDVYVTRDAPQSNVLLRNDGGGIFADVTPALLAITDRSQGATWGDYDNDGDLDLFVTNWQAGNHLFRNDGGFNFADVTVPGMDDPRRGQSGVWGDLNNDGWLDLYVASQGDPNQMWMNVPDGPGGRTFEDVTYPAVANLGSSTGVGFADFDQDGDLDIYVGVHLGRNTLLRNDLAQGNNWLQVKLVGTTSNAEAIGARLTLTAEELTLSREIGANNGMWSQEPLSQHFGLGSREGPLQITITWPSGTVQQLSNISPNTRLTIVEPPQRVRYVAIDGDDAGNGTAAYPYRTIQRAVDAAASGDTVVIRNGTYSGLGNNNVTWHDKNLAVRSASNDRNLCVIECAGEAGFTFVDANESVSDSLLFKGITVCGASIAISVIGKSPASMAFRPVAVAVSNSCVRGGGTGLQLMYCVATIDSTMVYENRDVGISVPAGCGLTITESDIRGNGTGLVHSHLQGQPANVTITASDFVRNAFGMNCIFDSTLLTLRGCRVDSSTAGYGIRAGGFISSVTAEDCSMSYNAGDGVMREGVMGFLTALRCNVVGNGGDGISNLPSFNTRIRLQAVDLSANRGWGYLGGYALSGASPAGVDKGTLENTGIARAIDVHDCDVRDNGMGGVWVGEIGSALLEIVIDSTSIVHNGGDGLRINLESTTDSVSVNNVSIAGNAGSGIVVGGAATDQCMITQTLVAANSGPAVECGGGLAITLACSDLYGNAGGDWTGPIAAQWAVNGNLRVDPRFCDPAAGNYYLQQDSPLAAENSSACGTIGRFDWNCPAQQWAPFVPNLRDVPDDQGGKLRVSWVKNAADGPMALVPVTSYEVQRFGLAWEMIATLASAAADSYSTVFDTPDIMTIGQPASYSRYRLVARTANPAVVFESVVDSAFSIDNLAPPKPAAMLVDDLNYRYILWTDPDVSDLATACVYRGTESGFTPDVPIGCPSDFYNEHDLGWYFYRAQFADIHGNLSEFSDELHGRWPTPVSNAVPTALRLYPCQPNPFNPRTTIKYDLPEIGPVRLSVFDVAGRLVRTLVDESVAQGRHEAVWDGRDSSGREVGSGSYLARLEFGGKVEAVRMGLLR